MIEDVKETGLRARLDTAGVVASSAAYEPAPAVVPLPRPRLRLEYLDGLRGLAALYVVFHHLYMELHYRPVGALPERFFKIFKFLDFGHYAVDVFIVLSGYCLMLPVANAADGALRGGVGGYLKRRARRILPPYYAALLIAFLAVWGMRALMAHLGMVDAQVQNGFTLPIALAHLTLLHNVIPHMSLFTDPPLWSVATEWQIYFFFPLFLVLWRRMGIGMVLLAAFALGWTPHYAGHGFLDGAYPWYLGLFALGMAGAVIGFSRTGASRIWRERVPWGWLCGLLWIGLAVVGVKRGGWYADHRWIADPVFGVATLCLLVYGTEQIRLGNLMSRFSVVRLLDARPSHQLGAFSYSLYLIHYPLLILLNASLLLLHPPPLLRAVLLVGIGVPLILLAAHRFYLLVEKPFVSAPASNTNR